MIFLASIQESLSVTSLIPKSDALSLITTTAGAVVGGAGGEGSKEADSCRKEVDDESAVGCAKGMKGGGGDSVDELLSMSRGTAIGTPPILPDPETCEPARDTPPATELLPLKVSGDIPPWLP